MTLKHPLTREITEQNAYHPEGKVNSRRQVDDWRGAAADAENPPVLWPGPEILRRWFAASLSVSSVGRGACGIIEIVHAPTLPSLLHRWIMVAEGFGDGDARGEGRQADQVPSP
jgi:hypothetical protein